MDPYIYIKNPYIYIYICMYIFCKSSLNISSTQVLPHLQDRPIGESLKHYLSLRTSGFC